MARVEASDQALLLSAGKGLRRPVFVNLHHPAGFFYPRPDFLSGEIPVLAAESNLVLHADMHNLAVRVLKDAADFSLQSSEIFFPLMLSPSTMISPC